MTYSDHYSVLKNECLEYLTSVEGSGWFADLTFGGGGHSSALIKFGRVIGVDQDLEAIENGKKLIKERSLAEKITLLHGNFDQFSQLLGREKWQEIQADGGFQGILIDLGVSSHQFDSPERGFSFKYDAPLDMRMNQTQIQTAAMVLRDYDVSELQEIFSKYGEEPFSKRIAERVVEIRANKPIERTRELEDIIFHCYPKRMRHGRLNPATKCFQALRIEVNKELQVLEMVIPSLITFLAPKGRLVIISFHSLEDRIVKHTFKKIVAEESRYKILTKRPIVPSDEEILENNRSRSAKLRVIERT